MTVGAGRVAGRVTGRVAGRGAGRAVVGRVGDPVDAAVGQAGVPPAVGRRAVGLPIGTAARVLAFAVETAPNATSTVIAIADAERPAEGRARGSARTGRDHGTVTTARERAATDPGSLAEDGRPSEATGPVSRGRRRSATARDGSKGRRRSATGRDGSRAALREEGSVAVSSGARIEGSIGRVPRSGSSHMTRTDRAASSRAPQAPTGVPRLDPIPGPTGRARGRTAGESRRLASRARTSPACSPRTRSWSPAGDRWRRHSSPDATPIG